jgi:hypothetical protein
VPASYVLDRQAGQKAVQGGKADQIKCGIKGEAIHLKRPPI